MTLAQPVPVPVAVFAPRAMFADFSLTRRAWESVGCPVAAGAVTGYCLGLSAWLYLLTAVIASITGIPAATQHRTLRGAIARTTVGGFAWAASVVAVFVLSGQEATYRVPDPIGWYLLLATLPATAIGWAVWTVTERVSPHRLPWGLRPARTS
jgi:hypothetical protein